MRQFVLDGLGISLSRSTCLNYLHRLGFVLKRPKKRLVKADGQKRESFVAEYAALWDEAGQSGAKILFADEAHFRADAELRGKWVLQGEPVLVDCSSPRYGEKASYYSAVCLETGEVAWLDLEGNSNSETSAVFLRQLRERYLGPLNVIWDNAPGPLRQAQEWRGGAGAPSGTWPGPAADEPAGLQSELQCRCGGLGLGERGGYRESVLGDQGPGTGEGRKPPGRAVQPERRSQASLPYRPAIKGRKPLARHPDPFPAHRKCTSHLGFAACLRRTRMHLLEADIAAYLLALRQVQVLGGWTGEKSRWQSCWRLWKERSLPLEVRVIRSPDTPYTPQSPQVKGGCQQGPLGSDVVHTTQQEPA